jgi:predicted HNH restriction endonuclease
MTREEFVSRLEEYVQFSRPSKARDQVEIFGLDTAKDPRAILNRVLSFLHDLSDPRKAGEIEGPVPGEEDEEETYREGRVAYRTHRRRERSRKLAHDKKTVASNPTLCEVCFQDYARTYGAPGKSVIECHHLSPVSQMDEDEAVRLSDLILVCANCHRMLHGGGGRSVLEVQRLLGRDAAERMHS